MIEIIAIIMLCNSNKENAVAAGKSAKGIIFKTILLWVGMELLGLGIGIALGLGPHSDFSAMLLALLGGTVFHFIVIAKKPSSKLYNSNGEIQNHPAQVNIQQQQDIPETYPVVNTSSTDEPDAHKTK